MYSVPDISQRPLTGGIIVFYEQSLSLCRIPVDRLLKCSGIESRNNVMPMTENTNIMITRSNTMFAISRKLHTIYYEN